MRMRMRVKTLVGVCGLILACATALAQSVVITEFQADNASTLLDADGESSDWVEIFNASTQAVNLGGWYLTDNPTNLTQWAFPATNLARGEFLVIFASGKNRRAGELHSNFKLNADGDYIALVDPATNIVSEFGPGGSHFGRQFENVSFGLGMGTSALVSNRSPVSVFIPTNGSLGLGWTGGSESTFQEDAAWRRGTNGVGYDTDWIDPPADYAEAVVRTAPSLYWRLDETTGTLARDASGRTNEGNYTSVTLGAAGPRPTNGFLTMPLANRAPSGDGNSGRVTYSALNSTASVGTAAYSAQIWINSAAAFGSRIVNYFLGRGTGGANGDQLGVWGSFSEPAIGSPTGRLFYYNSLNSTTAVNAVSATLLAPNTWYHVLLVRGDDGSATTVKVYLNGQLTIHTSGAWPGGTGDNFVVGHRPDLCCNLGFNGRVDEVAIWDRALRASEVQQLYQAATNFLAPTTDYAAYIRTDVGADMRDVNASAYLRFPFVLSGTPSDFKALALRINYDDGFVAYLNGVEVARHHAPGAAGVAPPFDAVASAEHPDSQALLAEAINVSSALEHVRTGTNILAIHALNLSPSDSDFLIIADLAATALTHTMEGYFLGPTPGRANGRLSRVIGPLITDVSHSPPVPEATSDLTITARLAPTSAGIGSATLRYRAMFGAEFTLHMYDDGAHGDGLAGDGIFGSVISNSALLSAAGGSLVGKMVRYSVTGTDTNGVVTREPLFLDAAASPEYFGTIVSAQAVTSSLPVLHWYVASPAAAETVTGTRASLYYDGEFYENVLVRIRGLTSRGWPKKSFKFEFNEGHHFRVSPNRPRVDEININATYTDKSYVRAVLGMETLAVAGVPTPEAFHIRLQQNGPFYSVAYLVEQVDKDFMRRRGIDTDGALYEFRVNGNGGVRAAVADKKTRLAEDFSDLQALVSGVHPTNVNRGRFIFDNIDLPGYINYMALMQVIFDTDYTEKNFFLHRDTEGSRLWSVIPWDKDLTFGTRELTTDDILADDDRAYYAPAAPTHPFFGSAGYSTPAEGIAGHPAHLKINHLMDAIINTPATREMYQRRLRTLMDQFLNHPATARTNLYFENRIAAIYSNTVADVRLDKARWFNPWPWGTNSTFEQALGVLTNDFLPRRRKHLFGTHSVDELGRLPNVFVAAGALARVYVPSNNILGTSWTLPGFDDSEWLRGPTGVGYDTNSVGVDFNPLIGLNVRTQMFTLRAGLFIRIPFTVADPSAVPRLFLGMKYDDGFVAYLNGSPVARRNAPAVVHYSSTAIANRSDIQAIVLEPIDLTLALSALRPGENILAIQGLNTSAANNDFLILPELSDANLSTPTNIAGIPPAQIGHPNLLFGEIDFRPVSGDRDEEYIELINTNAVAVDISGWRLTNGVSFTFKPGTVIPRGSSLYVSPKVRSLLERTNGPSGGQGLFAVGDYAGGISSLGETLALVAADGTLITTVTTPAVPSEAQQFLRITEIMYHPPDSAPGSVYLDEDFEFIELQNIGTNRLNLFGVRFIAGITNSFTNAVRLLQPGQFVVLVRNLEAFATRYDTNGLLIAGTYAGSLANGGETLRLEDAESGTILDFAYDDAWYPATDGRGASLTIVDARADRNSWGRAASWRASRAVGGSPGRDDSGPLADHDSDGLPDAWEQSHFGGLNASAGGDADADGLSNFEEYTAGTLPTDKTSRLALSVVRNHDDVTISFQPFAATGTGYEGLQRYYTLEKRPLLNLGDWQEVPGLSRILGGNQFVRYTEPVTGTQFFRLRAWLE